jgi:dolichol-phosphate mannosyltransferase
MAGPVERVLVLVPTYNERANLEPLTQAVHRAVPSAHVLIIDDNSPDGTGLLADELAARERWLKVLHRPKKVGLGAAYLEGIRQGLARRYTRICTMDCDFSHDPDALPGLLAAAEDADLVLGSRYVSGGGTVNWGLSRRFISRGGSLYARTILGVPVRDLTAGFRVYRRELLEALPLERVRTQGYGFQIEMTYRALRAGFRVVEVPIMFSDRRIGQSKMSRAIVTEAMLMVWKLRLEV